MVRMLMRMLMRMTMRMLIRMMRMVTRMVTKRASSDKYSGVPNLERVQPGRESLAPPTSLPVGVFKLEVLP